jgi:hypothetical protein
MEKPFNVGIETEYKGIIFRSRLEAIWGRFFDLMGWKWEYEPYDLNGWIPDFIIIGKARETLVEIKPYSCFNDFIESGTICKIRNSIKYTDKKNKEILLLGCTLFLSKQIPDATKLEFIINELWVGDDDEAILNYYNNEWGFFACVNSYEDRITSEYEGDHLLNPVKYEIALSYWNKAKNDVRWKKN